MLVHGGLSDSRVWRRQLEDLADEFTVIAWDAPGCGQSPDAPEWWRLPDYADCLAGFIRGLGLPRVHLLGHSFGGALVLEVYRRHPTVPVSLILASAYAGWAGSLPADEVTRRLQFAERAARMQSDGAFEPGSVPGIFGDVMLAETIRWLSEIMADSRPAATRAMARALAEADLNNMLSSVSVPTLLLHGEADDRATPSVARALAARISTSRLVVLPRLGHESYLESPDLFNAQVRSFLHTIA